ncbi:MAG: glyoxylate/hydroxypyruvate reductase A [Pseudomonadota bacterium]
MRFLFVSNSDSASAWQKALQQARPDITTMVYPQIGDPALIDYALAWRPPSGLLASLPNLKLIFSIGAGVDGLVDDPTYPRDIPLVRMVEWGLTEGMTDYVVWQVLSWHRQAVLYWRDQQAKRWKPRHRKVARERTVGILGLGVLGQDAAIKLAGLRFRVLGWSRNEKQVPDVECFHGEAGLVQVAAQSEILVCLLPLTNETVGILNRDLFAQMPKGACLINAARGRHLVEEDLLAALDSGQLSGASLDVFHDEPLPNDHPFWDRPELVITPHDASLTSPRTATQSIVDAIALCEAGKPVPNLVDFERGY